MSDKTSGGFIGDPAEAFTPPAAGGCCGSAPATEVKQVSTCCGTAAPTVERAAVAVPAAKAEPAAGSSGCCG
ncbi:MAG: hypothetical protein ABW215_13915 [Kibdelosporangium sp.]